MSGFEIYRLAKATGVVCHLGWIVPVYADGCARDGAVFANLVASRVGHPISESDFAASIRSEGGAAALEGRRFSMFVQFGRPVVSAGVCSVVFGGWFHFVNQCFNPNILSFSRILLAKGTTQSLAGRWDGIGDRRGGDFGWKPVFTRRCRSAGGSLGVGCLVLLRLRGPFCESISERFIVLGNYSGLFGQQHNHFTTSDADDLARSDAKR